MECKTKTGVEDLCSGLPEELGIYINYCKGLNFEDRPDYGYLRRLLRDLFIREEFDYDHVFDWTLLNYSSSRI